MSVAPPTAARATSPAELSLRDTLPWAELARVDEEGEAAELADGLLAAEDAPEGATASLLEQVAFEGAV